MSWVGKFCQASILTDGQTEVVFISKGLDSNTGGYHSERGGFHAEVQIEVDIILIEVDIIPIQMDIIPTQVDILHCCSISIVNARLKESYR